VITRQKIPCQALGNENTTIGNTTGLVDNGSNIESSSDGSINLSEKNTRVDSLLPTPANEEEIVIREDEKAPSEEQEETVVKQDGKTPSGEQEQVVVKQDGKTFTEEAKEVREDFQTAVIDSLDGEEAANMLEDHKQTPKVTNTTVSTRGRRTNRVSYRSMILDSDDDIEDEKPVTCRGSKPQVQKKRCQISDSESDFEVEQDAKSNASVEDDLLDDMNGSADEEDDAMGSESDLVLSEDERPKSRRSVGKAKMPTSTALKTKPPARLTSTAPLNASGKNTKARMDNLARGVTKGLDLDLAPIHKISEAFLDMTKNAMSNGLAKALPIIKDRVLRVATMCSGTESPLLALEMIKEALHVMGETSFDVVHLFSAEIVPYKQAYIERNFDVPIIFRDITELTAAKDRSHKATTAYGAKVEVPGQLDLLIAGTACVDYSMLNVNKKQLDDNGESGDTFRAVLAYAASWRPRMLILENVFTAPWDDMISMYENIDYAAAGALVDTKLYYLPQTRQRGYMFCIDKSICTTGTKPSSLVAEWIKVMSALRRPASSPATAFMLHSDDPSVLRARALLARRSLLDDGTREVDWAKCAIRHIQYRSENKIGNARPYTSWQESGALTLPDYSDHDWLRSQVERIWDMLDCSLLRKALPENGNYDIQYKSRIINVSQNLDRNPDSTPSGISSCLTPSGIFFLTSRGAPLSPDESLALQGLPLDKISFTTESPRQIQDMAGNAMSTTVVGAAILAALVVSAKTDITSTAEIVEQSQEQVRTVLDSLMSQHVNQSIQHRFQELELTTMLDEASKSSQKCACEGPFDIARRAIQTCLDCGHSTCISCGGKPTHNYGSIRSQPKDRLDPHIFRDKWESRLPTHFELQIPETFLHLIDRHSSRLAEKFKSAFQEAFQQPRLQFQALRRGRHWSAFWSSKSVVLELSLRPERPCWHLTIKPDSALPANDDLRNFLTQPIAEGIITNSCLENIDWRWRLPSNTKMAAKITGSGPKSASWLARLQLPEYQDQQVWNQMSLEFPGADSLIADQGIYHRLANCGTASECLYKMSRSDENKLDKFLMLDPDPIGDSKNDSMIITDNPHRLQFDEVRLTSVRLGSSWRPWNTGSTFTSTNVTTGFMWATGSDPNITLQPINLNVQLSHIDANITAIQATAKCNEIIDLCTLEIPADLIHSDLQVLGNEMSLSSLRWLFATSREHFRFNTEQTFELERHDCDLCTPPAAPLRWKWAGDGRSLRAYEDPSFATRFEEALKARPAVLQLDKHVQGTQFKLTVRLNVVSLAHRAIGKLNRLIGHTFRNAQAPQITWKVETSYAETTTLGLQTFTLQNNERDVVLSVQPDLQITLWPKQQRSLTWMLRQEADEGKSYLVEEVEEYLLPGIDWRVEVNARKTLKVRGGIQASHPGFGKTICTLALIQTDFKDHTSQEIVKRMNLLNDDLGERLPINHAGTLVIAPKHLIAQWTSEVDKVLGKKYANTTITIMTAQYLLKHDVVNFQKARIIILNQEVLTSVPYVARLATFAGVPEPAATKGRQFSTWLEFVNKEIYEHVYILQNQGRKALEAKIKAVFSQHMRDPDFESIVPSKRLKGRAYAEKNRDSMGAEDDKSRSAIPTLSSKDLAQIDRPLFEMFRFNRIVIDEFTYLTPKDRCSIENLQAERRWALSATAQMQDPYDIAKMTYLIGVKLRIGENAPGALSQRNMKKLLDEKTDFEQFQTFRSAPTMAVTKRTYQLAQDFLDSFVRQNILEFDDYPYEDHLVTINLTVPHRLVYTELSQHLNSADMRIRKGKKAIADERDREYQILENIREVDSAEEALSRLAALFDGSSYGVSAREVTITALTTKRTRQAEECKQKLSRAINDIVSGAKGAQHAPLDSWKQEVMKAGALGDEETTQHVIQLFKDAEKNGNTGKKAKQEDLKAMLSSLNGLTKHYMATLRSIRFVNNAQLLMNCLEDVTTSHSTEICESSFCISPGLNMNSLHSTSISSLCGHLICDDCWSRISSSTGICSAKGCNAPVHKYHLLQSSKLFQCSISSPTDISSLFPTTDTLSISSLGSKISSVISLLLKISERGDQAILFLPHEDQITPLSDLLTSSNIRNTPVHDSISASSLITSFQTNTNPKTRSTVIILNASNASAAGINLTNANHVLFLSPLLAGSRYEYEAAMAQAVGRVRRPGQVKRVWVYRFVALGTIDVDVLEHRERRIDEIQEFQGWNDVDNAVEEGNDKEWAQDKLQKEKEGKEERTQLIKDKKGVLRLMPKSWLVKGDIDSVQGSDNAEQEAFGDGVEGRARVQGYEDFSSLVKFSKAYSEGD